jgi:tetratricopeptide (TPR) repeat protein
LRKRARLYGDINSNELAVADISAVIALNPGDARDYGARAEVLRRLGRYEEAVSNHTEAIQLQSKGGEQYFSRGITYERMGQHTAAMDDFSQAIRTNPKVATPYSGRGVAALSLGKYEQAEGDYAKAIELGEPNPSRYNGLGQAQFWLGKRKEAQASFERGVALQAKSEGKGEAERLALIGSAYAQVFDYPTALSFYDQAVAASPTNGTIFKDRAFVKWESGNTEGARKDVQKAFELGEPKVAWYDLRALLYLTDGQCDQSIQDYEKVVRLRPDISSGYIGQGICYLMTAQRSKARETFEAGLRRVSADDSKAWLSMWCAITGGKVDEQTRTYLMQFSEEKWPYPLVRYYFDKLDDQGVLELAKHPNRALTSQQESDAYFYVGARSITSGKTGARAYFERAAKSGPHHWHSSMLARKQLERDFLTPQGESGK